MTARRWAILVGVIAAILVILALVIASFTAIGDVSGSILTQQAALTLTEQAATEISIQSLTEQAASTLTVIAATDLSGESTLTIHPTMTPGSSPTPLPNTGGGQSLESLVESSHILIRKSDSGEIIGNATFNIYAPASVGYPSTARIELAINLDEVYITPTPFGEITVVPRETSTPQPGTPAPATPVPVFSESGVNIYQRMGATLKCAETSFSGCDTPYNEDNIKLIAENVTTWSWIITPKSDVHGAQDVQVQVWAVRVNPDNTFDYVDVWSHAFQVDSDAPASASPILLLVGVFVLAGGLFAGYQVWQRRSVSAAKRVLADKPQVFISYRRGASWAQARSIANSIRARGITVFIDIDNIDEGRFAEIIARAIEECPYFVPILSPTTLESPWVVREIVSAMQHKRRIIPVLTDGFDFYRTKLPEEIQELASHNAITLTPEFYEEAIDRLVRRFLKDDESA